MKTMPYGTWPTPLTIEALTRDKTVLSDPQISDCGIVFTRTGASGAAGLAVERDGVVVDLLITDENGNEIPIGSRVHEYGGPAFAVDGTDVVISHRDSGRLYRASLLADPRAEALPITPADNWRYTDLQARDGHVIAIAEIHDGSRADGYPRHAIVDIDCADCERTVLYDRADFVAGVRLSPSGERITWYEWDLGTMPWDDTRVYVGERFETSIGDITRIDTGHSAAISPLFVSEDDVVFVDDISGWWNIYRAELGPSVRLRSVHPAEVEFAHPPWRMNSPYCVLDEDHLLTIFSTEGHSHIGSLNWRTGELEEWLIGYEPMGAPYTTGNCAVIKAGSATCAPVILAIDLPHARTRVVTHSDPDPLDEAWYSLPEAISWQVAGTKDYPEHRVHGFFYPPTHPQVEGPDDELPPLMVLVHGGPTSATLPILSDIITANAWTSRGFAVLDVNYAGSSGYGRAYRDLLKERWGEIDNADIIAGVTHLAEAGLIDPNRAVIRGGSAGGYAVLRALSTSDVFAAGASFYGVADLELLAAHTHMFEARYLDGLIGPHPEAAEVYQQRSPLYHLENFHTPLLLLQGEDDKVVPPEQSQVIYDALARAGKPVAMRMYPGEAHGFRGPEALRDSLATELAFYGEVLGFTPADIDAEVPWADPATAPSAVEQG